jgi:AcrR family transcriptional regulator
VDAATGNRLSPPPAGQRLPAGQRRALIEQAAVEVFASQGFGGTSLDEVARRAGVTKPLLYRHFTSKAELYVRLLEREMEDLLGRMATAVEAADDPEAQLQTGIAAFFSHVEERPFARRLLFRDPEARGEAAAAHDRVQSTMSRALADLLDANPRLLASDAQRELTIELFAQVLKTALNGLAAWWLAHPETLRETIVERAMQLLGPGLRELEEPLPGEAARRPRIQK